MNSPRTEYKLPPVLVACGSVTNTDRKLVIPSSSSSLASFGDVGDFGDTTDVKPAVFRFKLGEDSHQLKKLRGTSKPFRYNEDILFTKCYKAALKNDTCKGIGCSSSDEPGTRSCSSKKKDEQSKLAVAAELAKKLDVDNWTLDTPVPDCLAKIYEKNFKLDEEETKKSNPPPKILIRPNKTVMDWDEFLGNADHVKFVPPVTYFKHVSFLMLLLSISYRCKTLTFSVSSGIFFVFLRRRYSISGRR